MIEYGTDAGDRIGLVLLLTLALIVVLVVAARGDQRDAEQQFDEHETALRGDI